jgi:hypothetical protein
MQETNQSLSVASICEAPSLLKAIGQIKILSTNKDGHSHAQLREIFQTALTREVRSKPQRRAIIQALKNALKKLPEETPETPPSKRAKPITTEVIAPKEGVLLDASKALEKLRKVVVAHEEKFAAATLGPRLQIGLQCLKAYQVFVITDQAKKGQGRKPKNQVTRDVISPGGFEGWLATECQWLKKPTAYKYMTAVRGLALDHDATEKQVAAALKLKLRKGPVTIKALCDLALDPLGPEAPNGNDSQQNEFEFLKKACGALREEVDALVAIKAQLDAHPDFKRVATARLYGALYELTGTHWKPSDEPDSLADIDPDAIKI